MVMIDSKMDYDGDAGDAAITKLRIIIHSTAQLRLVLVTMIRLIT